MIIDGYKIRSTLDLSKKTWVLTYFVPPELDKGIIDQIRANVFGYVDDNISVFD